MCTRCHGDFASKRERRLALSRSLGQCARSLSTARPPLARSVCSLADLHARRSQAATCFFQPGSHLSGSVPSSAHRIATGYGDCRATSVSLSAHLPSRGHRFLFLSVPVREWVFEQASVLFGLYLFFPQVAAWVFLRSTTII